METDRLIVKHHKGGILVIGSASRDPTMKTLLKSMKGKWNGSLQGWEFSLSQKDEVVAKLQAGDQFKLQVLDEDGSTASGVLSSAGDTDPTAAATGAATTPLLVVKPHKNAILVTGDTLKAKEQLKALRGGWNRSLQGWCFPVSKKDEVVAALRKGGKFDVQVQSAEDGTDASLSPAGITGQSATATASTSAIAVAGSDASKPSLVVKTHKKAILVTGDTLKAKEKLKALNGGWNRSLQGWCFPASKKNEVVAMLRKDDTFNVEVLVDGVDLDESIAAPIAKARVQKRHREDMNCDDFIVPDD
mmetsp:Transcript_41278/g.68675  ORF Transcript_41278/g.68675 Transcript_41278/m.68675 type:complete len:303 (+) Transcript_41278:58-966(+)